MSVVKKSDLNAVVATTSGNVERKKPKRKVLEEDVYIDKLEEIIQRDFFPDIPKINAQIEYLDALERNDVEKIRLLQLRYSSRRQGPDQITTPRDTPAFFETPVPSADAETKRNPECETTPMTSSARPAGDESSVADEPTTRNDTEEPTTDNVGLDKFLQKFTSEDNASFEEILEKHNQKHREKYRWMYEPEMEHKKRMENALQLLGADEQYLAIAYQSSEHTALQNWNYKPTNSVMFVPESVEWTPEEQLHREKMSERQILHKNTRLESNPFSEDGSTGPGRAGLLQASAGLGRVDAQGNEVNPNQILHFGEVATPSPMPGVNESPMMTWGEIEGTPFRLDAGDVTCPRTPGPTFKMPEIPLRDKLAHEMSEKISKRNRDKKRVAVQEMTSNITPKFGSSKSVERLATLSPAAHRLATSGLGIRINTDKALKASYTPSPSRSRVGDSTPVASPAIKTEVESARKRTWGIEEATEKSLTDNLLALKNKKPRASDYF